MKQRLFLITLLFFAFGCKEESSKEPTSAAISIDSIFNDYYQFKNRINPIEATKAGDYQYNDFIANYISDDYQNDLKENYSHFLNLLNAIYPNELSEADQLSMKVMQWDCEVKLEGLNNEIVTMASPIYNLPSFELMPLLQIQSLHLYVAQLAAGGSVQPFATVDDYDNWLKRLDDYLIFLDTSMAMMREGMSKDIVLPKAITQKMIPQLDEFISNSVNDHLFFKPVIIMPETINEAESQRIADDYSKMITDQLKPQYTVLKQFLVDEYLPACRETSGIGALPHGPETYNYLIKLHTTTNMTADEIHELGKSEVARILVEMNKVKDEMGFEGDIKAFFEFVRNSPEQMPFTDPQQVIDNFNDIKARIELTLNQVFDLKPKADFVVRRTEAFREASASAEYTPGTKDASRPGIFYVPIPDVTKYNKYADEALFLHEAIPGHHYQLSLQQENTALPEFLHPESLGVFVEGWALYAESLGSELGLYEDPIQYFGMLSMEMHRAIRLVVDTGIHSKGWTREQAIQYSLDNEAESEASVISEIERYMATPGQALSYKIGQLKIRELRTKAETKLGDKFSVKEFHNQVLNSGSLPLVLLESKIDNWINTQM
ncbi:DUF885 domain-containing protein [Fulvivirga lutimaris]|uniref:DUF885 domain-containing protein n=1 Tax=Fulvivirga lutimaris TaxID=1819566 RepID=UPI0012BC7494|nr:DUF885 domain-containing protein [Fulvivirga lutimaris]MTI38377.1 DUF885 domain-containing protein [Fulvivirga lutimaris]